MSLRGIVADRRSNPVMNRPIVILVKILALVLIAYLAQFAIPYLGFFPYADTLDLKLPLFIKSFANFDGVQYLLIAKQGYATYQQAYFPLYPLLIKTVRDVLHIDYFYTALLISNIGFSIGLYYFYKLLRIDFDKKKSFIGILFLVLFPTSFFFHVVYTEGLFFALFISFLYFLRKDDLKKALILSIFLSATRLIGAFSIIFLIPKLFDYYQNIKISKYQNIAVTLLYILIPSLGLAIYMLYLWQTTGDPLFFFNSQPAFGANRSTHLIFLPQVYYRYFKMLFTAAFNWQYIVVLLELISFTFVAGILSLDLLAICHSGVLSLSKDDRISAFAKTKDAISRTLSSFQHDNKNLFRLSLNIFSWANILLPTLTGTFSSVPRYALFSISIFYFLVNLKNKFLQYSLLTIFAILQIILFGFFIQGYFIA